MAIAPVVTEFPRTPRQENSTAALMPPGGDDMRSNGSSVEKLSAGSDTLEDDEKPGESLRIVGSNYRSPDSLPSQRLTKRQLISVTVLCYVNLINYMDRFTLAGVLDLVQKDFNIQNDEGGLLQTVFVLSYMIFAPLFGYLGDRYNRKVVMAVGVALWAGTTLLGSFMTHFGWFLLFRALVGIGEASYSTIAPTIISDLFVSNMRSRMLAIFYFAIPVGSGLGYIVGSKVALAFGHWAWALRVTPILAGVALPLILCVLEDPERGSAEGGHLEATSYKEDLKYLVRNKSFNLSTLGFTCVAFVAGALAWWGPKFVELGMKVQGEPAELTNRVPFLFGLITMLSGILGVPLGSFVAQKLRPRFPKSDPMVCAVGLLVSAPLLFAGALFARVNTSLCFTFIFFGELFLNLNWAIVADILLYVVIPTRRSTAEAFQILVSHMFGDAGSPYLVGQVSEWIRPGLVNEMNSKNLQTLSQVLPNATLTVVETTPSHNELVAEFESLEYSLYICVFVEVLGGLFFIINGWFIEADRLKAEEMTHASTAVDHLDVGRGLMAEDSARNLMDSSPSPDHSYGESPEEPLDRSSEATVSFQN